MDKSKNIVSSAADFGRIVRKERKQQGYTQSELAELCGVGLTYVSHLENGKQTAELEKALHIVQMFGIDLIAETNPSSSD